jgi:hypothetical protein
MARGNSIIVSAPDMPHNQEQEGYVATGETFYPGMVVQVDPTVALKQGRRTLKIYNRDADGDRPSGPFCVVTEKLNAMVGKPMTQSYAAGERCSYIVPEPGLELNLLVANLAGTADDHAAGALLMVDDGTGKLIATTGSPETEVAQLQEAITDPTADTLAWCIWAGN